MLVPFLPMVLLTFLQQVCHCGTKKCRGFIRGKSKEDCTEDLDGAAKSKRERTKSKKTPEPVSASGLG